MVLAGVEGGASTRIRPVRSRRPPRHCARASSTPGSWPATAPALAPEKGVGECAGPRPPPPPPTHECPARSRRGRRRRRAHRRGTRPPAGRTSRRSSRNERADPPGHRDGPPRCAPAPACRREPPRAAADGGDCRLVPGQEKCVGLEVDVVAPARAGDRHRIVGLRRLGPGRRRTTLVENDVEIEAVVVEVERREGPDRRSAAVGEQELVAVPGGDDKWLPGRRQQQPHAGCRLLDGESFELGAGQPDLHHPGAEPGDPDHRAGAEAGGLPSGSQPGRARFTVAHCDSVPSRPATRVLGRR